MYHIVSYRRAVASGGAGGALAPPVFGQTVNPISTRGADFTHHSTKSPPGISDLATGLNDSWIINIWSLCSPVLQTSLLNNEAKRNHFPYLKRMLHSLIDHLNFFDYINNKN